MVRLCIMSAGAQRPSLDSYSSADLRSWITLQLSKRKAKISLSPPWWLDAEYAMLPDGTWTKVILMKFFPNMLCVILGSSYYADVYIFQRSSEVIWYYKEPVS